MGALQEYTLRMQFFVNQVIYTFVKDGSARYTTVQQEVQTEFAETVSVVVVTLFENDAESQHYFTGALPENVRLAGGSPADSHFIVVETNENSAPWYLKTTEPEPDAYSSIVQ